MAKEKPSKKPKNGRPSAFTFDIAYEICERIACGEPLTKITKTPGMPSYATVQRWLSEESEFQEKFQEIYARARSDQADTLADEIIEIADNDKGDYRIAYGKDGKPFVKVDHENVHRSKLRVDARKWIASKLKPKRYGERLGIEGPEGGGLITQVHVYLPHNERDDIPVELIDGEIEEESGGDGD